MHFEEDTTTFAEMSFAEMSMGLDVTESEQEIYTSLQGKEDEEEVNEKGKSKDKKVRIFPTFRYYF